ncbi:hypothetical protein PVAP13_9NG792366 [Panicum virgatum]|uniref:Uncharacterized protein n=1 Tax=Panicum virgatum TaxID=38727 RepID=A0A8T0NB29_PANVG|nr:hypothetical protein PVAP13_9NG792366 [Panicum virgatum]
MTKLTLTSNTNLFNPASKTPSPHPAHPAARRSNQGPTPGHRRQHTAGLLLQKPTPSTGRCRSRPRLLAAPPPRCGPSAGGREPLPPQIWGRRREAEVPAAAVLPSIRSAAAAPLPSIRSTAAARGARRRAVPLRPLRRRRSRCPPLPLAVPAIAPLALVVGRRSSCPTDRVRSRGRVKKREKKREGRGREWVGPRASMSGWKSRATAISASRPWCPVGRSCSCGATGRARPLGKARGVLFAPSVRPAKLRRRPARPCHGSCWSGGGVHVLCAAPLRKCSIA